MWQDLLCRGSRLVGWALYEKLDNVQSLLSSWVDDDSFNSTSPAVTAAMVRTLHHTHTHPLNGPCPGLPRWVGTRKVKPIWILLEQETVSGSGISWAICKSAPRSRLTTTPAPHHSFFTGRMPFLPPNQQRQNTESYCSTFAKKDLEHTIWQLYGGEL